MSSYYSEGRIVYRLGPQARHSRLKLRVFPDRRVGASLRSWDLPDSVMC